MLARDLGNVQQPLLAGEKLHERAEVHDALHYAIVVLANFRLFDGGLDELQRLLGARLAPRVDQHRAVIADIHVRPALLGDGADVGAAGTDQSPDLVLRDRRGHDLGGVIGDIGAWSVNGGGHDLEYLQAPRLGLVQRLPKHRLVHSGDLDVHLKRRDAVAGPGNLEVHVAKVIFLAEDVADHHVAGAVGYQSHGDAGHRLLDRDAGVEQTERSAAHRCHGRRAVRLQDLRHQPDGVRKLLLGRDHPLQRPLGEVTVAHLPAPGTQAAGLADRERREIVVQHEALAGVLIVLQRVQDTQFVALAAQGGQRKRLRLAAGEQGRTVRARQDIDLATDRANVVGTAAVGAQLYVQNRLAHHVRLQILEQTTRAVLFIVADTVGKLGQRGAAHFLDCARPLELPLYEAGFLHLGERRCP